MESITGINIVLRLLQDDDAGTIASLCNNKKIWDNVRDKLPYPYTVDDAVEFINICRNEDPKQTFVIEYKGEIAGIIGLVKQSDVYRLTAEVGYWIGEPYWGRGIATEAVKLIVKYGFEKLDLVRIYTGVFDFNKASQRVLEKAGFKLEAVFKNSVIKNNKIYDEYRYCILK